MRLIDADALNLYNISPVDGFSVYGVTAEDIQLAPTIECKQGYWIKTKHQGETFYKCSQCGLIHKYTSNYCDSCGADMRGEK